MKHAVSRPRMLCLSLVLAGMLVLGNARSAKAVSVQVAPADPPPVLRNGASTPALAPAVTAPSSPAAYNSVTGASTVTVTPASRDYGTVKVGQTTTNTFSVANTSTHDLDATTVTVGAPFAIVSPSSGILTVPKGTSKNVIVRFSPVAAGTFTKSVAFDNPNWVTTVSVTGKGALSPVAQFSGTPTNGLSPLMVTFTDSSTGTITNRVWTFGDSATTGTTATSVSHTYAAAGTYTVQLSVYGPVGVSTLARTNYIAVAPPPPALLQVTPAGLDFGIVTTGLTSQAAFIVTNAGGLALTGSVSVAAGPFKLSTNAYALPAHGWTTVGVQFVPTEQASYSHDVVFAGNGGSRTGVVTGAGDTPAQLVVTPLGLDFGTLVTGLTAQADFIVSNAGGATLTGSVSVGSARFGLSTNRLNLAGFASTSLTVTFMPLIEGMVSNNVVFTGNGGGLSAPVIGKGAVVPAARFTGTPTNGVLPMMVTFTDSSTGTITNRVWTFGDGTTISTVVAGASHTYAAEGTYTVQLSVYGPLGESTLARTNYIAVATPVPALLQVTPAGLDFGIVTTGLTAQAGFTVTNAGGLALTGSMAVAYGPFTLSAVSYSVPGYGWTNVTVSFSPAVLGLSTGAVLFAGNGGALDYPLSGVGTSPAAVSVIRLGVAAYSGAEGGKVKIKVLREGGSAGTVSVHYLTQNGTALAGSDYTAKAGTLTWLDGDTAAKVVSIAIRLDALVELKEQFKIKLNLPTGAILGTPASAKISIVPAVVKAAAPLAAAGFAPVGQAGGPDPLAEALDAAGLAWLTSPQAPWLAESAVTADGLAAARSGPAAAGQVSWLQTRVDGPGTVEFAWALAGTAAEAGLFLDNGKVLGRIGAGEAWLPEAAVLGSGPHTLEWVYVGGTTPEAGALYVDKVLWAPAP